MHILDGILKEDVRGWAVTSLTHATTAVTDTERMSAPGLSKFQDSWKTMFCPELYILYFRGGVSFPMCCAEFANNSSDRGGI